MFKKVVVVYAMFASVVVVGTGVCVLFVVFGACVSQSTTYMVFSGSGNLAVTYALSTSTRRNSPITPRISVPGLLWS